ncbi:MAG: sugar ABC transporter substrate-binding protein [Desulfovibrionales bacterium]|nr:sugar ABC transporter substrate-binding protein [Desulfovibrionales bacterium]
MGLAALCIVSVCCFPAFAEDYIIGPGDQVNISVWGEPDLTGAVLVRPDGKISLPGAGEIKAEGLTPEQLQAEIKGRIVSLVKDPLVTVSMVGIANSKAYLIGGGVTSGSMDLQRKTTLLQLLASLDLVRADLRGGYVLRDGKRLDRDFYALFHKGDLTQDLTLRNNDIIFLPALPEPYVYVLGAVETPKALPFREGMTVMDALLECGGFTKFADKNKTVIVRRENGVETRIAVKAEELSKGKDLSQNALLQRGDYIIANESFF